jgi:hypothetical protein
LHKLRHSQFLHLRDNYHSPQQWLSFWIHDTQTTVSCWDEGRTDVAPSCGCRYPL